jgi:hypothetical protein
MSCRLLLPWHSLPHHATTVVRKASSCVLSRPPGARAARLGVEVDRFAGLGGLDLSRGARDRLGAHVDGEVGLRKHPGTRWTLRPGLAHTCRRRARTSSITSLSTYAWSTRTSRSVSPWCAMSSASGRAPSSSGRLAGVTATGRVTGRSRSHAIGSLRPPKRLVRLPRPYRLAESSTEICRSSATACLMANLPPAVSTRSCSLPLSSVRRQARSSRDGRRRGASPPRFATTTPGAPRALSPSPSAADCSGDTRPRAPPETCPRRSRVEAGAGTRAASASCQCD